ncbi:hypothetical protein J5N97_006936 [Dioscorea zingiberensis]|uniref:Uncharacterized protein n=2 Tax=Magnoliopsida TaxID=3398 RepID=A0A9D5DBD3_9LILI|nr:hypothetical protein J5N97_006936 [Dioscorea zingiberensis]
MATVMQKIKDIEDEMARTQKNKATAHHLGLLKAKLAKLRRELLAPPSKGGGGGAGEGFDVTKSGDARVGLVGFPSVGKSTLLNKLTGTFSEVASYEFTTLTCIPGVIIYRGAKIQLLDLPGIIEGAKDGKGRGRQVISTARTCNCILIVLDAIKPITHKRLIEKELEGFGIRLNKEPPNLTFRKKDKGGINFTSTVTNTNLDLETVKAICSEYRIHNADISLRYDATADDLIDVIEGSRIYMPCIYVVNKIDQITLEDLEILDKLPHYCPVSAHLEWNLDGLLEKIWEYLDLTRIYTKPKGMNPDYEDPVILSSKRRTVEDFCNRIHKDMLKQFKYALVWGSSVKHTPQRVGKEHELDDEDVVQIIKKSFIAGKVHRPRIQAIHALSITSGFQSDIFAANVLLSGYSKSGHLHHARKVFDGMPQRNLISWSSMISNYTQHGNSEEALSLFCCLRKCFPESPNEFILASVLRACVQSSGIGRASQVHGLTAKMGFSSDVFVGTSLINFYAKVGCVEDAMLVFDELPVRNSVTWTAVISGYSLIGMSDKSLHLFNRMREEGVMPDRFVLSSVTSACAEVEFLEGGKQIHGYAYRSGADVDISVSNVLIYLYCKCSRIQIARRLFDSVLVKNLVSWTTMIAGYMQNSLDEKALDMFLRMNRLEFRPDGFACTSVLSSCGSLMALQQGKQVHGYTIKANLENDEYVKNGLIDMYAKCNSLVDARLVFDVMDDKNTVSYNAMIEGYAMQEDLSEVFILFKKMRLESLHPSLLTYVSLLGVSAASLAVELSKQVHNLVIKVGISLDLYAGSALIDVYSKCSGVDDARRVFDEMNERDLVVWNAMIFGYAQNGRGEEAVKLFCQLCVARLKPTDFTFVALVTTSSNLTSLFLGSQFHAQIIKAGVEFDPHVSNALVDMYAKCGCIQEARFLFDTMCGRDIVCWNSMISTCAQHGYADEALQIFHQMLSEKIEPNYVTFVSALAACSHAGLVEEGLSYFYSMKHDFGIEPGMEHYASVVSLLGRAGRLHEAKGFIEKMPIEPTAIVWRSFLSACRMFGDVELGNYGAIMATSTNPRDSGPYVLLSNIYASKGMWVDAEKVRKGMDQIGVVKEPGRIYLFCIYVVNKIDQITVEELEILDKFSHYLSVVNSSHLEWNPDELLEKTTNDPVTLSPSSELLMNSPTEFEHVLEDEDAVLISKKFRSNGEFMKKPSAAETAHTLSLPLQPKLKKYLKREEHGVHCRCVGRRLQWPRPQ